MVSGTDIRRIIIVGGGTAGWMAACYLSRFLQRQDGEITLIESPSIKTIGVGEATLPSLVRFIRNMGFDEKEFMQHCKATYKLGIKFRNWIKQEHEYWHPFGICGCIIDGLDLFHFWIKANRQNYESYSDYSLQALIAENDKSPHSVDDVTKIKETGAYAFHLDAAAFADYLKGKAVATGVKHVLAEVEHVSVNDEDEITQIKTDDGQTYAADLYIDCTGFRGLLINQALAVPFIDWSEYLLCDRAVALSFAADNEMSPNTRTVALDAGWSWQIPLSDRLGCGYVYSSSHKDDDAAVNELTALMNNHRSISKEPLFISMPVGHRQQFWKGNCLALGLAAGFLEPLESTGIHFIQHGLETFMDYFPDRKLNPLLINTYNKKMTNSFEEARDFLMLHYILSQRDDTLFWQNCRSVKIPGSLQALLDLYDETGIVEGFKARVFPDTSYFHILSGGGRFPRRPLPMVNVSDSSKVNQILEKVKDRNLAMIKPLMNHKNWIELINADRNSS